GRRGAAGGRRSVARITGPSRSVRERRAPAAARRSSTPGSGWPYGLRGPTEITAIVGPTAPRNAGVLDVREPWCATLRTVAVSGARATTRACSRADSMSDARRNDASPYSIRSTRASSFRSRRDGRGGGSAPLLDHEIGRAHV